MKIRLQKLMSQAGLCSRREAEAWIVAGRVTVNGATICELGGSADPDLDIILVDGKPLSLPLQTVLIAFYKPRGVMVTRHDAQSRPTVYDQLPPACQSLKPIGRLDFNSEGLLLFTNDGELQNHILHPRYHWPKRYVVTTSSIPSPSQLQALRRGAGEYHPIEVTLLPRASLRRASLEMVLHEGKNRQIHKMCEAVGLTVERLVRMAIGPVELGSLKPGKYRIIPHQIIDNILKMKRMS